MRWSAFRSVPRALPLLQRSLASILSDFVWCRDARGVQSPRSSDFAGSVGSAYERGSACWESIYTKLKQKSPGQGGESRLELSCRTVGEGPKWPSRRHSGRMPCGCQFGCSWSGQVRTVRATPAACWGDSMARRWASSSDPRLKRLADAVPRIVLFIRHVVQRRIVSLFVGFYLRALGINFRTSELGSLPDLGSRISTRGHPRPWTLLRLQSAPLTPAPRPVFWLFSLPNPCPTLRPVLKDARMRTPPPGSIALATRCE